MNTPIPTPPPISALLTRHATDAAFYWSQRDSGSHSPTLDRERQQHFDRLLGAHLDGLQVAGEAGWAIAFKAFERWGGAGETFVCAWLALGKSDSAKLRSMWPVLERDPGRTLRGLISALVWRDAATAQLCIERWAQAQGHPALQVAALRAAALRQDGDPAALAAICRLGLGSANASVRAAACRLAGRLGEQDLSGHLADTDLAVRAEAAIARLRQSPQRADWQVLHTACQQFAASMAGLSGALLTQATRRLQRWLRLLGLYAPREAAGLTPLRDALPPRLGLLLALHHGDPANLAWVADHTATPDCQRYAGWVWQSLTGIALEANGLSLPPTSPTFEDELISQASSSKDAGLPMPDSEKLRNWPQLPAKGAPILLGREADRAQLEAVYSHAPQALRVIAAHRLGQLDAHGRWDIRHPPNTAGSL